MCQRGGLLIAYDHPKRRALITDADCDTWTCPECVERLSSHWQLRAQIGVREFLERGLQVDTATMTSHEKLSTFEATAAVWPDAWGKLHKRLNRQADTCEYMLFPERHKDGRLHMHALWTFGVSTRWLKDNARECGLGYQAKIRPIEDVGRATEYATKYLSKQLKLGGPPRFRHVRVSSHWPKVPVPESDLSPYKWEHIGNDDQMMTHIDECNYYNLSLIDIRTGEQFDLGDTPF